MSTRNLYRFLSFVLLLQSGFLSAQTIVWGVGSGNQVSDTIGKFALPFGSSANAWTATSPYHGNVTGCAQVTPGAAFWTRSTTGRSFGNFWNNRPAINSPSMTDGVALFDSDFLDNGGTATFNSGTAPTGYNCGGTVPGHKGVLTSPTFDLSGYTDSTLVARFYLYYRPFTIRELSISISTDNGATWDDFSITQGVAANADFAPAWVEVPLFGALTGVTNLTQCKIKFTFDGYYYFAMVDDLSLRLAPDFDFAISGTTTGNTLGDGFTTAYTSDYRYLPITQKELTNFFYTARVTNFGSKDILPANNARIEYTLEKQVGAAWNSIFTGTVPVDTIRPQERITPNEMMFPNLNMVDTFGNYRATFIAKHDLADGTRTNDTVRTFFTVVEKHYSKCRLSATDGQVFASRTIFPAAGAGNLITEFEYGSMFYFPRGASDNVVMDSVNFRVFGPTTVVPGTTTALVNIRVYEFKDRNGDGTLDQSPTSNELTLVGLGIDTVPLTSGQYVARTTPIIDLNTFGTLSLNDTTVYFVTLDQRNPQGLTNTSNQYRCALYGADVLNYSINGAVLANGSFARNPAPVRIQQASSTTLAVASDQWNWVGFGANLQPSIRLVLSGDLNPFQNPTAVEEVSGAVELNTVVFPNPTTDKLDLQVQFTEEEATVTYLLSNVQGQIVEMVSKKQIINDQHQFEMSDLSAGVYFLSIKTSKGTKTHKIVKQ